jgi:hypothetical protein
MQQITGLQAILPKKKAMLAIDFVSIKDRNYAKTRIVSYYLVA